MLSVFITTDMLQFVFHSPKSEEKGGKVSEWILNLNWVPPTMCCTLIVHNVAVWQ